MIFTDTKESGLETLIVKWLVEHNGYEEGSNVDYNKEYAVDEVRRTNGQISFDRALDQQRRFPEDVFDDDV